jgi:hypothetical protein
MQRQLDAPGLEIKKGMIQDAIFIQSNPGHTKADEPRGKEAQRWNVDKEKWEVILWLQIS